MVNKKIKLDDYRIIYLNDKINNRIVRINYMVIKIIYMVVKIILNTWLPYNESQG